MIRKCQALIQRVREWDNGSVILLEMMFAVHLLQIINFFFCMLFSLCAAFFMNSISFAPFQSYCDYCWFVHKHTHKQIHIHVPATIQYSIFVFFLVQFICSSSFPYVFCLRFVYECMCMRVSIWFVMIIVLLCSFCWLCNYTIFTTFHRHRRRRRRRFFLFFFLSVCIQLFLLVSIFPL